MANKKLDYAALAAADRPDWVIDFVANGVSCDACGEEGNVFLQYICNAHTHGLKEKYDHDDLQMVLNYGMQEDGRILNILGAAIRAGEKFQAGDFVYGIYEDCPVRLDAFEECGRKVLRVIVPDRENRFPEDAGCTYPHVVQTLPMDSLYKSNEVMS